MKTPREARMPVSAQPFAGALVVGVSMRQTHSGWYLFRSLVVAGHTFAWLGLDVSPSALCVVTVIQQLHRRQYARAFFRREDAKVLFPLLEERCAHARTELGLGEEPRIHVWVLSESDLALADLSEVR